MDAIDVILKLNKSGMRYKRKASNLRYVKANGQSCTLYFKNDEEFPYGYRLKIFFVKIYCLTYLIKVHRSYIINLNEVVNYTYLTAIFSNSKKIPLNDEGYAIVKEFVDKKNSDSSSTAA